MQFVDHDEVERTKQCGDCRPPQDKECLEGFRCDQQNAGRIRQDPSLVARGHVAVPAMHRNVEPFAQAVEAIELVVDERLQRADVQRTNTARGIRDEM